MEGLRSFVVNLITILIFMTAVEIISPENNMKKYLNFVLGLILIAFLLNPVVTFFTSGETILADTISKYQEEWEVEEDMSLENSSKNTLKEEEFKKNFEINCTELLEEQFKNLDFKSQLEGKVDFKKMKFTADKLKIGIKRNDALEVSVMNNNNKNEDEIKEFINRKIKIEKDKIYIYYI